VAPRLPRHMEMNPIRQGCREIHRFRIRLAGKAARPFKGRIGPRPRRKGIDTGTDHGAGDVDEPLLRNGCGRPYRRRRRNPRVVASGPGLFLRVLPGAQKRQRGARFGRGCSSVPSSRKETHKPPGGKKAGHPRGKDEHSPNPWREHRYASFSGQAQQAPEGPQGVTAERAFPGSPPGTMPGGEAAFPAGTSRGRRRSAGGRIRPLRHQCSPWRISTWTKCPRSVSGAFTRTTLS
jgi:hypothetical protein